MNGNYKDSITIGLATELWSSQGWQLKFFGHHKIGDQNFTVANLAVTEFVFGCQL
jgi:hypothetical protein